MSEDIENELFWKYLLKKHWIRLLPFLLIVVAVFFSGIYVFLWHNEIGGYWIYTFNDWSFAAIWVYLFWFALREFLLVGLPAVGLLGIVFAIIWFSMSEEMRAELKERSKSEEKEDKKNWWKSKDTHTTQNRGFGGFFALVMIAFLIIVFVEGNWETPFSSLPLLYFVKTYIVAMIWVAIICGIPATIAIIFWLKKKLR